MSKLEDAEKVVAELSAAEKAQLVQSVARELGNAISGIESHPNVCGGEACIARTRIPVWVLEQARRLGTSEAELLQALSVVAGGRSGQCLELHRYAPQRD